MFNIPGHVFRPETQPQTTRGPPRRSRDTLMFLMSKLELNVPPGLQPLMWQIRKGDLFLLISVPFGEEEADVVPLKLLLPELHPSAEPPSHLYLNCEPEEIIPFQKMQQNATNAQPPGNICAFSQSHQHHCHLTSGTFPVNTRVH